MKKLKGIFASFMCHYSISMSLLTKNLSKISRQDALF
jgi:hypothetical protein